MIRALAPDEIVARKRPKAILVVYLWELVWALIVVAPIAGWARRVWSSHPDGDAPLFAPGGRALMAWLDLFGDHSGVPIVFRVTLGLVVVGAFLSQIPLAMLLASLATGRGEAGTAPRVGESLRTSGGSMIALSGVLIFAAFFETLVVGLGLAAAAGLDTLAARRWGDGRGFVVGIAVFAVFAIVCAVIGVIADLARAAIVREVAVADEPSSPLALLGRGIRRAFRVGFRGLGRAFVDWGSRAAVSVALLAFGALASEALGGKSGLALAGLAIAHQLVVLLRTALRASWLARALRLVGA